VADRSQDNFHCDAESSICGFGHRDHSNDIPVQDLPLSERLRTGYRAAGSINHDRYRHADIHKDIHDPHKEHNKFLEPQDGDFVRVIAGVEVSPHNLRDQLLFDIHLRILCRVHRSLLHLPDKDHTNQY
jgi:hypothetical protein